MHKNLNKQKERYLSFFLISILMLNLFLVISNASAREENITGFSTLDTVNENENVSYHFSNNIIFEISANSKINLSIEYEPTISNRQSSFSISNNESLTLSITSKVRMRNFGISKPPSAPMKGSFQLRYQYNCIFRLLSNASIESIIIRYNKNQNYGLSHNINYSLAIYDVGQETWELVDTQEYLNESSSELLLESTLLGLGAETEYYITLFEFSFEPYDWTWLYLTIIITAVSILSIAFLISKKDYFIYLRKRTVSIEKGAHRLSLDEVLENENRNKIIDLILKEPGIHFNELMRKTELAAGNLVWHLDILQTYKIIGKKRVGNFIAYFPYYQKNPISNVDLKLQKSKLTLEILEMIEKEPGIWNNIITKKFKVDHKTIHYHLKKLYELGLIKQEKEGRKKKIFPNFDSEYYKYKENN